MSQTLTRGTLFIHDLIRLCSIVAVCLPQIQVFEHLVPGGGAVWEVQNLQEEDGLAGGRVPLSVYF